MKAIAVLIALAACSPSPPPPPPPLPPPVVAPAATRDSSQTPDQIKAIQVRLTHEGLYHGAIDGRWGPETDAALAAWQKHHGLMETGKLDTPTLASFNAP